MNNKKMKLIILLLSFGIWLALSVTLLAQSETITSNRKPNPMNSGKHTGAVEKSYVAFRDYVESPGASSLRLHFSDYNLGSGSYIKITSMEDGASQHLNAKSIVNYHSSSAYFNGDAIKVELYIAPGDENIFFQMKEVTVFETEEDEIGKLDICDADDRIRTTNPAIARVIRNDEPWGTAYIIMNGALLTARHVFYPYSSDLVEFNCPSSDSCGSIDHPFPVHQYAINHSSIVLGTGGNSSPSGPMGQDYAIFNCHPNSETGLVPIDAQLAFYRIVNDEDFTSAVRVTGYGGDNDPIGECEPDTLTNSDNYTLQTNAGVFIGEEEIFDDGSHRWGTIVKYILDTAGGCSGSPVEKVTPYFSRVAIGIHTFGGCTLPDFNYNAGTGFDNEYLMDDIKSFHPPPYGWVFLDKGHPFTVESGTIWNPILTLWYALNVTDPGGTIVIAGGSYTIASGTIDENVTLKAVGGTVTISQ